MSEDGVPHHSREDIERLAERSLAHYAPDCLQQPSQTPLMDIVLRLHDDLDTTFCFTESLGVNSRGRRVLGACYFAPRLAVFVDRSLTTESHYPRFRFTLAHELGHLRLHRKLVLDFQSLDATDAGIRDSQQDLSPGRRKLRTPRDFLEWQANSFASSFLIPRTTLPAAVRSAQEQLAVRRSGTIFVDDQSANVSGYNAIVGHLNAIYQTTRTTTLIRLRELGLVNDRRSEATGYQGPVLVGSVLAEIVAKMLGRT
jgi:hypothetical protein